MGALEKLWRGQLHPSRDVLSHDRYVALSNVATAKKKLLGLLTEEEKDIFNEFLRLQKLYVDLAERDAFFVGYRTATSIMLDSFPSKRNPVV